MPAYRAYLVVLACLALLAALLTSGQTAAGPNQTVADAEKPARVDLQGDPLSPGALGRLGTTRLRHAGGPSAIAWSPDGTRVATAGGYGTVQVWDAATGKGLGSLKGQAQAEAVAFSSDGKVLLAASQDGRVQHWDAAKGVLLRQVEPVRKPGAVGDFIPYTAIFSLDRKLVCLHDYGKNLELRDVNTGECRLRLSKQNALHCPAVSPDGKTLAVIDATRGRGFCLWDIATGKEWDFRSPAVGLVSVQFAPDGKTLAASSENELWLWKLDSRKEVLHIKGAGGRIAFSPDGKNLVASEKGLLRLWDASTGRDRLWEASNDRALCWFQEVSDRLRDLSFSPDGKRLCVVGPDREAAGGIWDVATGKPLRSFEGYPGFVGCLAFSPDGVSANTSRTVLCQYIPNSGRATIDIKVIPLEVVS